MSTLSIKNLNKSYGKTHILKDINLDVEKGEFVILVGPSGCGKSTLLNLIAGLDNISSGEIIINGKDMSQMPPKNRDIAMIFQSYALYPHMTVRGNISFGLKIKGIPKTRIAEIVSRVAGILQIEKLLKRKPFQLSGGQRQRVAMGRAISRDASLYLFDEPLSNLDAKLRVEMRHEIKKLHRRVGQAIIYVTHDQIEAMTLGEKIAIMKDGVIVQYGTPDELYDHPNCMFVGGFIGSHSMNFVKTKIIELGSGIGGQLETAEKTYVVPLPDTLKNRLGKNIILGIRPEKINNVSKQGEGNGYLFPIEIKIELTEPTGADTVVFFDINNSAISARCEPSRELKIDNKITLNIEYDKMRFFDTESEEVI